MSYPPYKLLIQFHYHTPYIKSLLKSVFFVLRLYKEKSVYGTKSIDTFVIFSNFPMQKQRARHPCLAPALFPTLYNCYACAAFHWANTPGNSRQTKQRVSIFIIALPAFLPNIPPSTALFHTSLWRPQRQHTDNAILPRQRP